MAVTKDPKMLYPYEYFTNWVEDRVIHKRFTSISDQDRFVDEVEKIRQYCFANKQGQFIFKKYFEMDAARKVTKQNITFRDGVEAQRAWDKLVGLELEEARERGFADELRKLREIRTSSDWIKRYRETIEDDNLKNAPKNKSILLKELEEHEQARLIPERTKKRLRDMDTKTRLTDIQQGEGAYAEWSKRKVEAEIRKVKETPEFRRISRLDRERVSMPYGEKMQRMIKFKQPMETLRSYGIEDRGDLDKFRQEKNKYEFKYNDILEKLPERRKATFERKFNFDENAPKVNSYIELQKLKQGMDAFRVRR